MLTPGLPFPELAVQLVSGEQWTLERSQYQLTLISVIRGFFCTYCHEGMVELNRHAADFAAIGIDVLATSTDDVDAAASMTQKLALDRLPVGFGLTEPEIRRLGLFATERNSRIFAEPAIVIVRRDRTVYAVFQNSISCGRTDITRLLEGLQLLSRADFPLRGNA